MVTFFLSGINKILTSLHENDPGQTLVLDFSGQIVGSSFGGLPFEDDPAGNGKKRRKLAINSQDVIVRMATQKIFSEYKKLDEFNEYISFELTMIIYRASLMLLYFMMNLACHFFLLQWPLERSI